VPLDRAHATGARALRVAARSRVCDVFVCDCV